MQTLGVHGREIRSLKVKLNKSSLFKRARGKKNLCVGYWLSLAPDSLNVHWKRLELFKSFVSCFLLFQENGI